LLGARKTSLPRKVPQTTSSAAFEIVPAVRHNPKISLRMSCWAVQLSSPSTPMYARVPEGTHVSRPRPGVVVTEVVAVVVGVVVDVVVALLVAVDVREVVAVDVAVEVIDVVLVVVCVVVGLVCSHPLKEPAMNASKRRLRSTAVSSH